MKRGLTTVLDNLTLVDTKAKRVLPGQAISISGQTILNVGNRDDFGTCLEDPNVRYLDLQGLFVLPGLVDAHVHLLSSFADRFGGRDALERQPPAVLAHCGTYQARESLQAGITTMRVVGEQGYQDVALRDSILSGVVDGPWMQVSGRIIIRTAGHGSGSATCVTADGVDEVMKVVRAEAAAGVDVIKLMGTGGVASAQSPHNAPQFFEEELEMAIRTATSMGMPVAIHAGNSSLIGRCAELGMTSVEHAYELDADAAQKMAEAGTRLVPTLVVTCDEDYISTRPKWIQERARKIRDRHIGSFQAALEAGVKIAVGTDIPEFYHYTHKEIRLLARMGMSNWDALEAATVNSAELCGVNSGCVSPGYFADLIGIRTDPTKSLALCDPPFVMKAGRIYRNDL